MTNSKYLILACDGGGIRGLIPALLLQQLPPSFLDQVYLLAGTSTGGIISLALACNVSPDEIVSLYENDGGTIFKPSACRGKSGAAQLPTSAASLANVASNDFWQDILQYLNDIICVWYDNSGLRSVIQQTVGSNANATLNSLIPSPPNHPLYVLVNTLQLCDPNNVWTPLQLTNLPNITNGSGATLVIDAAMSTSAAPMYFPPYPHPTYGFCADGGMFANNPGTIALTTLVQSGVALEDIWMLSLSTGNTLNCYPPSIINGLGTSGAAGSPFFWFYPVPQTRQNGQSNTYTPSLPLENAVFDGTSQVDTYHCQQLLGSRYQRANVLLSQPVALDDYSQSSINAMKSSVTTYLSGSDWAGITSWIKANFP